MSDLRERVLEAAGAARLLLEREMYASACTRAYYAMFNMARLLLAELEGVDLEDIRRHRAVLKLFSMHFVKDGRFDASLARRLREGAEIRAVADYDDAPIDAAEASEMIMTMEAFLEAAGRLLQTEGKSP